MLKLLLVLCLWTNISAQNKAGNNTKDKEFITVFNFSFVVGELAEVNPNNRPARKH